MTLEKAIKQYLDKRASEDDLFAKSYQKENKNIAECCKYIISQAKKQAENGCAAIHDEEVFGWAVHYYDEDDIKVSETSDNVKVSVPDQPKPVTAPAPVAEPKPKKQTIKPKKADRTSQPVFTLFDGML